MDEESLFKLFLASEQQGKKRKRSQRTVELHLELYRRMKTHSPNLAPDEIRVFLLSLFDTGRTGRYLNHFVDCLHVYGRFKQTDLYKEFKYFPEEDFEKATMSDKEIEDFLALPCPSTTRYDVRLKRQITYPMGKERWKVKTMFWKCLAYSGARPGEIATLTKDSVDFGRGVFVVTGKTGNRIVPIAPILISELSEFIGQLKSDYLFPSRHGRMSSRQKAPVIDDVDWGYDFHQRLKRLGIKRKNLTPYSLRHSFITRMLDEDINVFKVQDVVGHRRLETTKGYYHMTTKTLIKTVAQDPLTRQRLSYNERFQLFRNHVRQLLTQHANDHHEERKMLKELLEGLSVLLICLIWRRTMALGITLSL